MTKKQPKLDVQYFIDKFKATKPWQWTTGRVYDPDTGKMCALGLCGARIAKSGLVRHTRESNALQNILAFSVEEINDNLYEDLGGTPRARILNALKVVAKRQAAKNKVSQ